jgi:hypothetical protein
MHISRKPKKLFILTPIPNLFLLHNKLFQEKMLKGLTATRQETIKQTKQNQYYPKNLHSKKTTIHFFACRCGLGGFDCMIKAVII